MEIIVGMLLFGMVVLTMTAAINPLMMAYRRANDLAEYNQLLDTIGNRMVSEMAKTSVTPIIGANALTIVVDNVTLIYTVNAGGHLQLQRGAAPVAPVYQPGFYEGKTIAFNFDDSAPPNYFLNLTVTSNMAGGTSGSTITRQYAVRPLLISP